MDENSLREIDQLIDLESGTDVILNDKFNSCHEQARIVCDKDSSDYFNGTDGLLKGEDPARSSNDSRPCCSKLPISNEEGFGGKKTFGEEMSSIPVEMGLGTVKPKNKRCKKPPRPPQSSRSLPFDDTDQKLIKELSDLAALRQARIERMKKKLQNIRPTSHNSNWCALIITILFFLVIIWQGFSHQGRSSIKFHGSPESSVQTGGGLITLKFYGNMSRNYPQVSTSASSKAVEPMSGDDHT